MAIPSRVLNISATLRAIRIQQRWSKSAVEEHTGISRNTLRRIESGETTNPGMGTVLRLLAFYQVDVFIGGKLN